jgi:thioredoxin reductase (NADPH)
MDAIAMSDTYPPLKSTLSSGMESVFPTLKPTQIERMAAIGRIRKVTPGEVLVEAGQKDAPIFVVKTGHVEVVQPSGPVEKPVALFASGQFTGEVSALFGRRILVRVRAKEAGEVIEIDREHLTQFLQTDTELSDIFIRAFILRRVELISQSSETSFSLDRTIPPIRFASRNFLDAMDILTLTSISTGTRAFRICWIVFRSG